MSCGIACPCQPSCAMDTQGSKRDPISSEKAWLDSAVRFLSREAVCKGKGQEAVWSPKCKPSWWDDEVRLPWKNPTANPKDTKEVLVQKYNALSGHLRHECRFPMELEEEAKLWAEGKYRELFFLTWLSSLKGKATGFHFAVREVSAQANEMKAEVNENLIKDIQSCLRASLKTLDNLSLKSSYRVLKRCSPGNGKENVDSHSSVKKSRLENVNKTHPDRNSKVVSILPKESNCKPHIDQKVSQSNALLADEKSKKIVSQLQKVLKKRKELSAASQASKISGCVNQASLPSPCALPSAQISASKSHQELSSSPIPVVIEEIVSQNLSTNSVANAVNFDHSDISTIHSLGPVEICSCPESRFPTGDGNEVSCGEYVDRFLDEILSDNSYKGGHESLSKSDHLADSQVDYLLSPFGPSSNLKEDPNESKVSLNQVDINSPCSVEISPISPPLDLDVGIRIQGGRLPSNSNSFVSDVSDTCSSIPDSGCVSDTSFIDSILSPEEQNEILMDDDIAGILSNFDGDSPVAITETPGDFLMTDLENFVDSIYI